MRGRKKSEDTRLAILRCAAEVFSERSYHEVLTDDISARLRIGKGTLYRYFASKEELYFASIVEGLQGMQEVIERVIREPGPIEHTLEQLARTLIGYFWERRDFFVLLHRHEVKLNSTERAEWQKGREELVGSVATRVAAELGDVGVDPRLAVEIFFGMIRSVCLYRDESATPDDTARLVSRMFLNGLRGEDKQAMLRRAAAAGKG